MLELLTCSRGHFWERSGEGAPGEPLVCPECGAQAEALPLLDLAPETAPAPLPPPIPPAAPRLFDDRGRPVVAGYEILEDLGRALTGVRLYRARQTVVNRRVLLKVVAAREDAGQQAWSCLRGEASALGKLSHPNILSIHEAGERDRQLFYNVVELVEGPTLAQKTADKLLPFRQIVRLMELLARAVEHAHQQGLLHRNLKPSSILFQVVNVPEKNAPLGELPAACMLHSEWYIPRITGFGLTRRPIDGDPTDVDLYDDEAGYLSPEQAWGRAKDISQTADVYGLGGVLYFLLTGRPPFRGPTLPDILDAVQTAPLIPPADIRSVPGDLDAICRKCLARQPRRRYPSAGALADDLCRARLSLPLAGKPASNAEKFGKWLRRRPAVAGLILVAFLGLVGSLTAYCVGLASSEGDSFALMQAHRRAAVAEAETRRLHDQLEKWQEKERFMAYRQQIDQARQELDRNNPDRAQKILRLCDERQRGVEWHYLDRRTFGAEPIPWRVGEGVASVAFDPQNDQALAVASSTPGLFPDTRKGLVKLWDVETRREKLTLSDFMGPVHALCFSPDGRFLATAGGNAKDVAGQVGLWTLEGELRCEVRWSIDFHPGRATDVAFSPDQMTLMVASGGGTLHALSLLQGERKGEFGHEVFAPGRTMTTRVRYSADGGQIASFTGGDPRVRLWNPASRQCERTISGPGNVQDIALSRQWLAVARSDNTVRLYDRQQGNEAFQIGPLPRSVRKLAFSADGARLAGACEDDTVYVWALVGAPVELIALKGKGTSGLAFSHSGKRLAAAGTQTVVVWGAGAE